MTRIIDAKTSIQSMRDSGYKNEAYAIAELMDNSIQANATIVELITFSSQSAKTSRQTIDSIAIFDNGIGMEPELLQRSLSFGQGDNRYDKDGMGKFGFGLPSASISQCKRVEVWSWTKNSEIHKTYIDVDEIVNGDVEDVPKPQTASLPDNISKAIGDILPKSGTVVLWSKIDRANWKTSIALSKHVEHEIGRMYRYYLSRKENPVTIKFKSYNNEGSVYVLKDDPQFYRPSDPLEVMKKTSLPTLPEDYADEAFFELADERKVKIKDKDGNEHEVQMRWSIVKQSIINAILEEEKNKGSKRSAGDTKWGHYVKKNQGISVVRSNRELILRDRMLPKEEKWRFIGMEIKFPPALDDVFGVLNNKQDAVHFNLYDKSDDSENEGFDTPLEYINSLDANDPKHGLYKVSDVINEFRQAAADRLREINVKLKPIEPTEPIDPDGPYVVPTPPQRPEQPVNEPFPEYDELVHSLIEQGIPNNIAYVVARKVEHEKVRYLVQASDLNTDAFFDVTHAKGITLIIINRNHIFYKDVLNNCDDKQKVLIELTLGSFGYMEHDSRDNPLLKGQFQRTRRNWGVYLTDVLQAYADENE
ncbi:MAG: ATP-binding protein [Pseudomonadota bacterium]|nr:ATP-binding protein [Pseudomonadota bacterium]